MPFVGDWLQRDERGSAISYLVSYILGRTWSGPGDFQCIYICKYFATEKLRCCRLQYVFLLRIPEDYEDPVFLS